MVQAVTAMYPLRCGLGDWWLDRSDAVDFHIERTVPSGYEDETARRRVDEKIARVHAIDRLEMSRIVALDITFDHLVER